jgi:hypothetical protein
MKKVVILKAQTNNYYFFDLETGKHKVLSKKKIKNTEVIPWIVDNYLPEDLMKLNTKEFKIIEKKIKKLEYKDIEPINKSYQKALKSKISYLFI